MEGAPDVLQLRCRSLLQLSLSRRPQLRPQRQFGQMRSFLSHPQLRTPPLLRFVSSTWPMLLHGASSVRPTGSTMQHSHVSANNWNSRSIHLTHPPWIWRQRVGPKLRSSTATKGAWDGSARTKDETRWWSWHELIAQLTEESRAIVVNGPHGRSGGVVGCSFVLRPKFV